jgi:hypothetical protein
MNISEPDNPEQGTDNAQTQADDTAPDWDYFDPDEEQDTETAPATEATDDGTEATDEAASTEVDQPEEVEASADAVVTMQDGSKVKVSDLIQGQLRQSDYTRKTQEIAQERTALKGEAERIESITTALVDHLHKLLPPMPDHSLALRDPNKYTREKAIHEAALAQLQGLIEIGDKPKQISASLSEAEMSRKAAEEGAKLTERFPEIANPQARQKFLTQAVQTAAEFGVSLQDLQANPDHRIFAALHYAAKGLQAEKAMQSARAKAAAAPPMAKNKPPAAQAGNSDAVKRFQRNPSLRNAAAAWSGD